MPVPLLDLNRQNLALERELNEVFQKVLRSGQFILGPDSNAFEQEIAQFIGVKHALAVSSGTDAILLALMALGIGAGDEVLCPSFTFFATAGCVARLGAKPVFCDAEPVGFNIDPERLREKITSKTKAIIPVHLFGQSADMTAIEKIANEFGLKIVEDAAQAIGAKFRGQQVGTFGTFGAFSFFPSKNLGAFGDGGLLVTNDSEFAERAAILRVHGMKPKYYHTMIGANFRLDTLQCAFLRVKLREYPEYIQGRSRNAAYYQEKLSGLESEGGAMILPKALGDRDHTWNQYTLRILKGQRDALKGHLGQRKIGCETYYPVPLHRQECFAHLGSENLPVSDQLAAEALSIPIFPELSSEELKEVVAAIQEFFHQRSR